MSYIEDFATIIYTFNQKKIHLEDFEVYLSNRQINTYRTHTYSHRMDYVIGRFYNKNIYNTAISIAKYADKNILRSYNTSIAYN